MRGTNISIWKRQPEAYSLLRMKGTLTIIKNHNWTNLQTGLRMMTQLIPVVLFRRYFSNIFSIYTSNFVNESNCPPNQDRGRSSLPRRVWNMLNRVPCGLTPAMLSRAGFPVRGQRQKILSTAILNCINITCSWYCFFCGLPRTTVAASSRWELLILHLYVCD